jgi:peptide/nickel transport system substrate-binding protein
MQEYVHGQYLKAVKNPNYWQPGKPYLDGVEFDFIRDTMTQNMAIQSTGSDGIDVLNINSAEQISQLKATSQFDIVLLGTGPVIMTPSSMDEKSPLSKLEVRQALSYAIDRDALVAARGFGIYTAGTQLVPPNSPAYLEDSYNQTYDQQKAKDLLTQAGYPDGFNTTIYVQPGIVDKDSAQAIQQMLAEVGIKAELQFPDAGGHATLRSKGWDGIMLGGLRNFSDPYLTFFLSFDPFQMFMVSAARPQNWMVTLFSATGSPQPDPAAYKDVHKALLENLTAIPVYNMYDSWAIKKNVHDTHYGEYERCNLESAWLS